MIGRHLVKSWSSTQQSISLSSGEAEMMGVTRGAMAALGFRSLLSDFGVEWPVRIWTDSTASIGMCSRQGFGKVRHIDTQVLWIQQRIRNGDLDLTCLPRQQRHQQSSVPDTASFDWHAPLVEWCGGRKIKIGVPGSIPVCTLTTQFTSELTLTLTHVDYTDSTNIKRGGN